MISQKLALVEMMTIRWILEAPYFQSEPDEAFNELWAYTLGCITIVSTTEVGES